MAQKPPLGARKDEKWYAIGIEPSITKTPIGPIQVPVPYQVISDLSTAMGTSNNVTFNGQPAYLLDQSTQPQCTGDEQGSSGGTRSGTTSMEVKPVAGSGSVKINGKAVIRNGDPCTLNKENCKGKFVKTSPPNTEMTSHTAKVDVLPIEDYLCPNEPVEFQAIATPKGTSFEWSVAHPFELVDKNGDPVTPTDDTVHVRLKKTVKSQSSLSDYDVDDFNVEVSVKTTTANGRAEAVVNMPIHSNIPVLNWKKTTDAVALVLKKTTEPIGQVNKAAAYVTLKTGLISEMALKYVEAKEKAAQQIYDDIVNKVPELENTIHLFAKEVFQALERNFNDECVEDTKLIELESEAHNTARRISDTLKRYSSSKQQRPLTTNDIANALDLMKRFVFGRLAYNIDGDVKGFVEDGIHYSNTKEGAYNFSFGKDRFAVVAVPGMNWEYFNTKDMEESVNYSFDCESTVRIRNYKSCDGVSLFGDFLQSLCSELSAIDPHSIATAVAISEGLNGKKIVYVVAHSQGSEITRSAFEFIVLYRKIPKRLKHLIFETTIFQSAIRNIFERIFPVENYKYLYEIPRDPLQGIRIPLDKIINVGYLDENCFKNVYYQGFGSETYISPKSYGLAFARNARTAKDLIPYFGDTAKIVKSDLSYLDGYRPSAKKVRDSEKAENWEILEMRAHVPWYGCCLDVSFTSHEWLLNYWAHLRVPLKGELIPKAQLDRLSDDDFEKLEKGRLILTPEVSPPPGFSCVGVNSVYKNSNHTKKKSVNATIAIFLDETGQTLVSGSNLSKMMNSASRFLMPESGISGEKIVTAPFYRPGPGSSFDDPIGVKAGVEAVERLNQVYGHIVGWYKILNRLYTPAPSIDIFGFGRGGAIASALTWKLSKDGLNDGASKPFLPGDQLNVRFLGLFDATFSMILPDDNEWDLKRIAPNVKSAAYAFAGSEPRAYLKPLFLLPSSNSSLKASQLIFPGVHEDVGGNSNNDEKKFHLMTLTRHWMIEQAFSAGLHYFEGCKPSDAAYSMILNTPAMQKEGPVGYKDGVFYSNPFQSKEPAKIIAQAESKIKSASDDYFGFMKAERPGTGTETYNAIAAKLPEVLRRDPLTFFDKRTFPNGIDSLTPVPRVGLAERL